MGHSEFGQLLEQQASHSQTIAGLTADVAYWRSRCERAEYARQALEHHNAVLKAEVAKYATPERGDPAAERIEVEWPLIEATVVVDGFFEHIGRELWDISIDTLWLRGVDITSLIDDRSNLGSLHDAIDRKLTADLVDQLAEAA